MIRRHITLISCLVFAVLALGLHLVKFQVQALHEKNSAMQHDLETQRASLALLEAEWMVLNHPKRLAELAERAGLQYEVMTPKQMESWQGLAGHRVSLQKAGW